jgi:plastocyanin
MGRSGRLAVVATVTTILVMGPASAALACGGLVAPNGTVNLLRTTTLAAYHGGIEHYITSFTFAGDGEAGEEGSIVPLPGVPTDVVKGGDWTLQRLVIETERLRGGGLDPFATATVDATAPAQVLLETQIDALDITVLSGGAIAVGEWAREHGFLLPPDAPEVLEFYASRSPVFMAARFDADRAAEQGIVEGQGTPIHVTIPTPNPWVPLRILALGRQPQEFVQADVYLLTDVEPAMLPQAVEGNGDADQRGLVRNLNEPTSRELLADLRSDRGMSWLPARDMWLTHVVVNAPAAELTHDLAIDASGFGQPSPVAAGVAGSLATATEPLLGPVVWAIVARFSSFEPATIEVEPGETVRFVIRNADPIDHEFIVGDARVQRIHESGTEAHHDPRPGEVSVPAGETVATYTFAPRADPRPAS